MNALSRLGSEIRYLSGAARMLRRVTPIARQRDRTFPHLIEDMAERFGDRPALLSGALTYSFRQLNERANRYARWARAEGLGKGDRVCLILPPGPDYVAAWLGIARSGASSALVNTQLAGAALAHSVDIVRPKHVILGSDFADAWRSAAEHLGETYPVSSYGGPVGETPPIESALDALPGDALGPSERAVLTLEDPCLYIYTSGTTGEPKAANVNHYRIQAIAHGFSAAMKATSADRSYICLPLYHSAGGVLALGAVLTVGGSAFIAPRYSSGRFWTDVVENQCTLFQYIGEMCRYLVGAPEHPMERRHKVRLVCGNGMRPDVWPAFAQRFKVPRILEYYAATEGNAVIFNFDNREGSVGRVAKLAEHRFPMRLVRFDADTEAPVRGPDGFCIPSATGEVGELLSEIVDDPLKPAQRFEGYVDKGATERKILKDVFQPGDRWFRTGDLMRQDEDGYYYFVDRIGDTFRWKSENVATLQVAETLMAVPGVHEATVFGVKVGPHEGRAGMAAIVPGEGFDLAALHAHCVANLPPYARPLFIRIVPRLDTTTTHKQQKGRLATEGFDPAVVSDPIYFDDPGTGAYRRLDAALCEGIVSGTVRL